MAGMFDMYRLSGNRQALDVLQGMAAWADEWTAGKSEPAMQEILKIEFGGIAETLYNVAAAIQGGRLLGLVPKTYLPSYREFYETRQFREGYEVPAGSSLNLFGEEVPFGTDLLFAAGRCIERHNQGAT